MSIKVIAAFESYVINKENNKTNKEVKKFKSFLQFYTHFYTHAIHCMNENILYITILDSN